MHRLGLGRHGPRTSPTPPQHQHVLCSSSSRRTSRSAPSSRTGALPRGASAPAASNFDIPAAPSSWCACLAPHLMCSGGAPVTVVNIRSATPCLLRKGSPAPSDGMPRTTTSRRHAVVPLAIAVAFRRWTILRVLSNCKGLRITFYSVRHLRLLSLSPSQGPSRRNRTLAMTWS